MNLETLRQLLLWSTVINFACLLLWAIVLIAPHGWIYQIHGRFFRLRPEQIDLINYGGIVFYELMIVFFSLIPYLVLFCIA